MQEEAEVDFRKSHQNQQIESIAGKLQNQFIFTLR